MNYFSKQRFFMLYSVVRINRFYRFNVILKFLTVTNKTPQ